MDVKPTIPQKFWDLLELGLGGYLIGRPVEKVAGMVTKNVALPFVRKKIEKTFTDRITLKIDNHWLGQEGDISFLSCPKNTNTFELGMSDSMKFFLKAEKKYPVTLI